MALFLPTLMPSQHFCFFPLPSLLCFHDGNLSQQQYVRRQRREKENCSLKGDSSEMLSLKTAWGFNFIFLEK